MAGIVEQATTLSGILLAAFSVVGTLLVAYLEHPAKHYEDKVKELQQDRWRPVTSELGEVFVTVEKEFTPTEVAEEDAPLSAKYGMFINSQYNRGMLEDLEENLEDMDEPKKVFQQCRNAYSATFPMFILGIIAGVFGFVPLMQFSSPLLILLSGGALGAGAIFSIRGGYKAYIYWETRQQLDEMWDEYHLF